jgi:hypothetical protein
MIQLAENITWDKSLPFEQQSGEVINFVNNVISSYDRTTIKEAIPNSQLFRPLSYNYELENAIIKQSFDYVEPVNGAGWAAVELEKIECYGK